MPKYLPSSDLYKALAKAGIASEKYAPKWLYTQELKGNFVYPRHSEKEQRRFTATQIKQIVKAFSPGGKGRWALPKP